jgi:hypothetical protein
MVSSLVGHFRAAPNNWVDAPFHGLKPVEEGRHRDLPLHPVSPFGALVLGRHPASRGTPTGSCQPIATVAGKKIWDKLGASPGGLSGMFHAR